MKKSKVASNYLYNVAYQILTFITPFITTPYLARVFGSESLGIYNYTYSIVYWFILFGMLGLSIYGNREIAKVRDNKELRSRTFSEIFLLQTINVLISMTLFYIVFRFFDKQYYNIFILQGLMVFATLFDISWFYNGIENFKKITIRNFVVKIFTIVLIFLIIKNPSQVVEYVWINIGMTFFSNIVMWINLKSYVDFVRVKIKDAYKHFKNTFILFLPQIATTIYSTFTQTMIGFLYTDISEVAFYNQAYKLITMCLTITTTIGTVMLPRIVNSKAHGGEEKVRSMTNKTFKIALFLAFPIAFGLASISVYFVPWFLTEEFKTVGYLLMIMAPALVFISMTNVMGTQYLLSCDRDKDYTISVVCGCVLNVLCNFILITQFGSIGAAIATVITEGFVFIIQYFMVRKTFDFTGILKKGFKYFSASLMMGIIIFIIGHFMGASIITNIVQFLVGVCIYIGILYLSHDGLLLFLVAKLKEILHLNKA